MKVHRYAAIVLLAASTGCTDYSSRISDQFNGTGRSSIDLMQAVPTAWDRVCVLGPYSLDEDAERTLGFKWPVESRTDIEEGDGIALLLFVRNDTVVEYVDYPRDQGDFSGLASQCFKSSNAKFRTVPDSRENWARLVPASEA